MNNLTVTIRQDASLNPPYTIYETYLVVLAHRFRNDWLPLIGLDKDVNNSRVLRFNIAKLNR